MGLTKFWDYIFEGASATTKKTEEKKEKLRLYLIIKDSLNEKRLIRKVICKDKIRKEHFWQQFEKSAK